MLHEQGLQGQDSKDKNSSGGDKDSKDKNSSGGDKDKGSEDERWNSQNEFKGQRHEGKDSKDKNSGDKDKGSEEERCNSSSSSAWSIVTDKFKHQ